MAGLAALLSFGSDRTTTQTIEALSEALAPRGTDAATVDCGAARLLIRSALPKVHESAGTVVIVDGIAEPTNLFTRYAGFGPTGLVHGQHPYALILADPDGGGLVLARNLDGPPLYYARTTGAVVVASEPVALLRAGVPATPNDEVIARFLDTGTCDDVPATFFDAIRRVLPGQVVEIGRHTDGWSIRAHPCAVTNPRRTTARLEVMYALSESGGRAGIALVDSGPARTALLEAAADLPTIAAPPPVPQNIDDFLADLGEPAPDLADYLLWAAARAAGGEIDVLLSTGSGGHLSRLVDRIAARYGVAVRFPLREPKPAPPLAEALQRIRPAIAEALLYPRYGGGIDYPTLATLSTLSRAKPAELQRVWRTYLVQRWVRAHAAADPKLQAPQAKPLTAVSGWQRHAIPAAQIAWHVGEFVNAADKPIRQALRQPWLLIVAAEAVAIEQGEARPVWDITPGRLARALSRLGGKRFGNIDPWTMQVALELRGRLKLCATMLFSPMRYRQSAREIHRPREWACPPAHISVVGPPRDPGRAATDIANELRRTLPDEIFATLRGCAIVGAGRVLAWCGPQPPPAELLVRLGDGHDGAMIALSAPAPASGSRKTSRKPAKRR
ncbi:hypothetical protein [Allorhizocola rhizosphaerae]|uniref:hypothetical protein n=1 Tax=Allorhizocola rhizosphaerae TaxID=1872709 RepID=UPI000E3D5CB7|nr:hypothetical protein [Allorhizocola rhizosphaerae]